MLPVDFWQSSKGERTVSQENDVWTIGYIHENKHQTVLHTFTKINSKWKLPYKIIKHLKKT